MLYLASQSPRRAELLTRLGLSFGRIDLDIPEQRQPGDKGAAALSGELDCGRLARVRSLG